MLYDHDDMGSMATMGDAHREWHRNAGVPMGNPGCPMDACHLPDEGPYDEDWPNEEKLVIDGTRDYVTCARCHRVVPIIDGRHGSTRCPQCQEVVS